MDLGAGLTLALLAALLAQAWARTLRLQAQPAWLVTTLLLNAMSLPAALLLLGDAVQGPGLLAGFGAVLAASGGGLAALIWLYRIEHLPKQEAGSHDHG